ncbi:MULTISPECIES: SusC/RagA family TonB-linked outer membrane protein [unclassified Paraflavitalea]|uniref:SusC/RagA family TonB-linked outer membrane protein n=1 Tax=unclassified Paraflavitalea TaxID=2798305 RepID=UPI003D334D88
MQEMYLLVKKRVVNAIFLLLLFPGMLMAQELKTVTGKVTDGSGNPIQAASVKVKGAKGGTTTNASGVFTIKAKDGDVIEISAVSFGTKEITVGSQTNYNVSLEASSTNLNDVVVVGYGKGSKKTLSSSITSVKAEELNRGAISDVGQLLQGKVPGLNITASGDPNKTAAVILRGASTLNAGAGVFYVIDGVPGADIATVAPDDIATIDVLKDAAASAIYGNRASNGVIIITTKKGKKGQATVSYSGYVGMETVSNRLDVMNATELRNFVSKNGLAFTPADDKGANTDWQKEIQRSGALSHNHNIAVSGGGEHSTYFASLNYFKKEGIIQKTQLERVIAKLGIEQSALNDKLKFGFNVTNSISTNDDVPYLNTIILQSALYLPVNPVKNADGSYFENFVKSNYYNPVSMLNHATMQTKSNLLIGSATAQVKLPFGITYDLIVSYQKTSRLFGSYLDKYFTTNYNAMYDNPDPGYGGHGLQTFGKNGQATRSSYEDTRKVLETFFTWDKRFGDHSVNAVVGYSWQDNILGNGFSATTSNFPVDNILYNNLALSNPTTYGSGLFFSGDGVYQRTRLISDFARVKYNYKEKYLLQASLRHDGGSMFGSANRWGYFPSVGAAWRIGEENFLAKQNAITDLKLRVSYGVTGNAAGFNPYTAQFLLAGRGNYYYNGSTVSAIGAAQTANPYLKWEKTAMSNIGVDFSIFKKKINVAIDLYEKKTTDMIIGYAADPMLLPNGGITANGGAMTNRGIELNISGTIVDKKDFSWTTNLGLASNKNTIDKLTNPIFIGGDSVRVGFPEGGGQSGRSIQLLKEGYPLGQFFTFKYAGKNAQGISQWYKRDGTLTTSPQNGTDYFYLGNAQPKLIVGFANTLRYKKFDLNVMIRGVFGNKIMNATKADLFRPSTAMSTNILSSAANETATDVIAYTYSDRFIESGNYVRFDNATLAYNFGKMGNYIKSLRVYLTGNNLFVITKFTGVDPEVNQGGIAPGIDYNNFYPKTRTVMLGVNVSF